MEFLRGTLHVLTTWVQNRRKPATSSLPVLSCTTLASRAKSLSVPQCCTRASWRPWPTTCILPVEYESTGRATKWDAISDLIRFGFQKPVMRLPLLCYSVLSFNALLQNNLKTKQKYLEYTLINDRMKYYIYGQYWQLLGGLFYEAKLLLLCCRPILKGWICYSLANHCSLMDEQIKLKLKEQTGYLVGYTAWSKYSIILLMRPV